MPISTSSRSSVLSRLLVPSPAHQHIANHRQSSIPRIRPRPNPSLAAAAACRPCLLTQLAALARCRRLGPVVLFGPFCSFSTSLPSSPASLACPLSRSHARLPTAPTISTGPSALRLPLSGHRGRCSSLFGPSCCSPWLSCPTLGLRIWVSIERGRVLYTTRPLLLPHPHLTTLS